MLITSGHKIRFSSQEKQIITRQKTLFQQNTAHNIIIKIQVIAIFFNPSSSPFSFCTCCWPVGNSIHIFCVDITEETWVDNLQFGPVNVGFSHSAEKEEDIVHFE